MIEADVLREYNIDLAKEFYTMTWRRFIVLLSGLSQNSAFLNAIFNDKESSLPDDDPEMIAFELMSVLSKGR